MPKRNRRDVLFDLRVIISLLFGVYGLVCLIWGLAYNGPTDRARSGDVDVNLWAGVGMLIFAAAFLFWALRRPLVPSEDDGQPDSDGRPHDGADRGPAR